MTMYHAAPRAAHDSIARQGLRAPVYVFEDASNAAWYCGEYTDDGEVWTINAEGLRREPDPEFQIELGASDGWIITQPISSDRLQLINR